MNESKRNEKNAFFLQTVREHEWIIAHQRQVFFYAIVFIRDLNAKKKHQNKKQQAIYCDSKRQTEKRKKRKY